MNKCFAKYLNIKPMPIEIRHRYTNEVLYTDEGECKSILETFLCALEEGADLEEANLRGANLAGVNLKWADLARVDLTGANLIGAKLIEVDLEGADLTGVDLMGADLRRADLKGANLGRVDLRESNLEWSKLTMASLEGANLRGVNLSNTKLEKAKLGGANLPAGFYQIVGIGSKKRCTTYDSINDKVICGCFYGTLKEFEEQVKATYEEGNKHRVEYLAAIVYFKSLVDANKK